MNMVPVTAEQGIALLDRGYTVEVQDCLHPDTWWIATDFDQVFTAPACRAAYYLRDVAWARETE